MDIYNPSISEQLSYNANMAEQWVLTQEREGQDCGISDPAAFFQVTRDFSNALERMAKLEKETDREWSISLFALVELAQLVTATLSELTQGRFISCLILLRPAQELAQTVRYALKEGALIEWYEYSIEKDIRDFRQQISIIEDGISGNWPFGFNPESAKEAIAHGNTKIQELESLKLGLGDRQSSKGWTSIEKRWQPTSKEFARRLKGLDPHLPLQDLHTSSWITLNGYVHARSREFSAPPNLNDVMSQLLRTMYHINLAGIELAEKFSL